MTDGSIFYDPRAYSDLDRWHAAAATIRREDPVLLVEPPGLAPFWAVTRHAHVVEVERQPERFWNTVNSVLDPSGGVERLRATGADLKTLIHMDGTEHRDYRAITNDWMGVHFCLGAHLARMELRAFFRELLPRLESIELAGEPEYTVSTFVGGPKRVPIRYRLRPAR
jgi:cytochrome P450